VDGIDAVLVIRLAISRAIKPLLAGAQALALWRYGRPTPEAWRHNELLLLSIMASVRRRLFHR